jgi:hypothetical protein
MMRPPKSSVVRLACWCALGALALMTWSLFDPRPLPVIAAMSVGQVLGTMSFVAFLFAVARDLRRFGATKSERADAPDEGVE